MSKIAVAFSAALAVAATLAAQGPQQGGPGFGGPGMGMMAMAPGARTPVTGAPYSGVQTSQFQQTLANGNQINRQEQSKVYRDSQGRVRNERTMTDPATSQTRTMIMIFDPVGGFSYMLNPANKTAMKMPVRTPPAGSTPPTPGQGRREPQGAQVQTTDLGSQIVNGLAATGTRVTETIPAGAIGNQQPIQVVREVWTSTVLKVPVSVKTTDPRFGNSTMQLTGVVQTEPDPTLFQVPSDYTVRTGRQGMGGQGMGGMGQGMGGGMGQGMGPGRMMRGQRQN
jgi:hypothetical protein